MPKYLEEKNFTIRLEGQAYFPEDYEGEEDGYEWVKEFNRLKSKVHAAVVRELNGSTSFIAHPENRGRSSEDEITIVCSYQSNALTK